MGGPSHKPSYMVEAQEYHDKKTPGAVSDSSVFSNPFKAKEDRKRARRERHVEMTSKQEDSKTLRGKKICWNFRKGRCRQALFLNAFGTNTSFNFIQKNKVYQIDIPTLPVAKSTRSP